MKILAVCDDDLLARWVYDHFSVLYAKVDLSVAVMDESGIVAAAFFQAHNGPDVELSYYGPRTLTLGVLKGLMRIAVNHLGVARVTVRTSKHNKTMTRGVKKLGFVYEGIRKHGYGKQDAVMFGLFGRNLARLAGSTMQ